MPIVFKRKDDDELRKNRDKYCPYLKICRRKIPRNYFLRICNTGAYQKCQFYAKKAKKLNTPMTWLQKLAIKKDRRKKTTE
jgi:hypothetical protein